MSSDVTNVVVNTAPDESTVRRRPIDESEALLRGASAAATSMVDFDGDAASLRFRPAVRLGAASSSTSSIVAEAAAASASRFSWERRDTAAPPPPLLLLPSASSASSDSCSSSASSSVRPTASGGTNSGTPDGRSGISDMAASAFSVLRCTVDSETLRPAFCSFVQEAQRYVSSSSTSSFVRLAHMPWNHSRHPSHSTMNRSYGSPQLQKSAMGASPGPYSATPPAAAKNPSAVAGAAFCVTCVGATATGASGGPCCAFLLQGCFDLAPALRGAVEVAATAAATGEEAVTVTLGATCS